MTLIVLDDAEDEFREAVLHYESITPDLGRRFKEEFSLYVSWIIQNPISPRLRPRGYRRVNLRVFPYYIAYIIHENRIWIVAITHGRRKPHYWIQRKQKTANKALQLTTYRAGLGDGGCISRAGGTVTPAACLVGR